MYYFLFFIIVILLLWILLIYIRKTMWDAVHRNLLDLEDHFEGKVMRRSFATRPFFHGKINGHNLTINFSTAKSDKRRLTYLDISYALNSKFSFTLSNRDWLEKQDAGELQDVQYFKNSAGTEFVVRPVSDKQVTGFVKSDLFLEIIDELDDLAYIFAGQSGLLCEFISEEIIKTTEFENST